jgi:hypothetical protein
MAICSGNPYAFLHVEVEGSSRIRNPVDKVKEKLIHDHDPGYGTTYTPIDGPNCAARSLSRLFFVNRTLVLK